MERREKCIFLDFDRNFQVEIEEERNLGKGAIFVREEKRK